MNASAWRTKLPLGVFVCLLLVWIFLAARDWVLPFPRSRDLPAKEISAESGHAYTFRVPGMEPGGPHAVLREGRREAHQPLGFLSGVLGWSRVHYYLSGLIARRFPGSAVRTTWSSLGPPDQLHDAIRRQGGGRYSAWNGLLYFSASDSSDPRLNGRSYRLDVYPLLGEGWRTLLKTLTVAMGLALLAMNARRLLSRSGLLRAQAPGIVISAILVAVLFVAGEAYLRVFVAPFTETAWPTYAHPKAGMLFKPGAEVRHTNHADFWVTERANSLGFLDREPAVPKPPGTFRILVLGDSFIEAAQVPTAKKFHVLLEKFMDGSVPGRQVDTVALGFSGSGQSTELSFYEEFGKRLAPDLVIIVVISNDISNNSPVLESIRNGWHPYHAPRLFFEVDAAGFRRVDPDPDWKRHLIHSASADPVRDYAARIALLRHDPRFARMLDGWRFPEDLDMDRMLCAEKMPPVFDNALAITSHVFTRFAEAGSSDGFKVLVVAADNVTSLCKSTSSARRTTPDRILARVREAAGSLPVLDIYPAFAAKGNLMQSRFRYDSHWSETGHAWAAEAVADYLKRNPQLLSRK